VLLVNAVTIVTFAQQQQDDDDVDDDVDTAVVSLLEKLQEQHNAIADPSLALPEIETIFFSSSSAASQQSSPSPTIAAASSSIPTFNTEAVSDSSVTSAVAADPLFFPPTSSNNVCLDPSEIEVSIYITPDAYPSEISWTLTNLCDSISTSGGPYSINDGRLPQVFQQCIPNDTYEFSIYDTNNDGICCDYGTGRYSIGVNGVEVHSGNGKYGSSDTVIIGSGCANTEEKEEVPTMDPTVATTTTATATTQAPTSSTSSLSSIEETSSSTHVPVDEQQEHLWLYYILTT
jgi:hypothetical protein